MYVQVGTAPFVYRCSADVKLPWPHLDDEQSVVGNIPRYVGGRRFVEAVRPLRFCPEVVTVGGN